MKSIYRQNATINFLWAGTTREDLYTEDGGGGGGGSRSTFVSFIELVFKLPHPDTLGTFSVNLANANDSLHLPPPG